MYKILILILIIFNFQICSADDEYIFPSEMEEDNISENVNDPLEKFNRGIFVFNHHFEKIFIKPITKTYIKIVPEQGQKLLKNFLNNLMMPVSTINHILILDPRGASNDAWRFIINSTIGLGGIHDFASNVGLKRNSTNFDRTLAHYKIYRGPYLVLPIIGPSTTRDAIGRFTDAFIDPINYISKGFTYTRTGLVILDSYSDKLKFIDRIENNSLDPYITIRSLYLQNSDFNYKK